MRLQFIKTDPQGRTVNPGHPDGYVPLLRELDENELAADIRDYCHTFTDAQAGDWPHDMFKDRSIDPLIPAPLWDIVHKSVMDGKSLPASCADLVHMDEPLELAQQISQWCRSNGDKPVNSLTDKKTTIDFVADVVEPPEYMLSGLADAMRRCFQEKSFWDQARPEEYMRVRAGLGHQVTTAYPEGCPPHAERPAGHGVFAGYITERARQYYGDKHADVFAQTGQHLALWRVLAGVHTPRSCIEGYNIGVFLAAEHAGLDACLVQT